MLKRLCLVPLLGMLITGCAGTAIKPAQPVTADAAGVVVQVPSPCLPLMPCGGLTVSFARLPDDGALSSEIYRTSVEQDGYYYLLNVPPGRYVAVASSYARAMNSQSRIGNAGLTVNRLFGENIFFPRDLVDGTETNVKPGELAVMGRLDYDIEGRMAFAPSATSFLDQADAVQKHYARQLDLELETRGVTSSIKFYRAANGSVDRSDAIRNGMREAARTHIGNAGWQVQIDRGDRN